MAADILIAFRKQPQARSSAGDVPTLERWATALSGVEGVVAARAFTVNVIRGERPPALYPELVMCRLDAAGFDRAGALGVFDITGRDGNAPRPDGLRFAAWEAASVGGRDDFDLPEHLYLQFSANPPSMSFEDYSDWYQVHQDENIAQTDGLLRGWRFRLTPRVIAVDPGPTHLALYEIDGPLERVTGDLGRAMEAGVISLPDWFTRFASLEGVATGDRLDG
jgi:hypothetical protein